jgi:hypothetical protein
MKSDTFDQYVRKMPSGCWEWTGYCAPFGHGRYRQREAHRVAFERSRGPIPAGMHVCHTCDNPPCVNPDHLWLGTNADNTRDMVAKGRSFKWNGQRAGAANPFAKLTPEKVVEIRSLRGKRVKIAEIAKRFGVAQGTISSILSGRTWASVGH